VYNVEACSVMCLLREIARQCKCSFGVETSWVTPENVGFDIRNMSSCDSLPAMRCASLVAHAIARETAKKCHQCIQPCNLDKYEVLLIVLIY